MPQAMIPVVAEIVEEECKHPGDRILGREVNWSHVRQDPLIKENAQKTEEYAYPGGNHAAAQTVDSVSQVIVVGALDAVGDELDGNEEKKDRHGQCHSLGIHGVHRSPELTSCY